MGSPGWEGCTSNSDRSLKSPAEASAKGTTAMSEVLQYKTSFPAQDADGQHNMIPGGTTVAGMGHISGTERYVFVQKC